MSVFVVRIYPKTQYHFVMKNFYGILKLQYTDRQKKKGTAKQTDIILLHFITNVQKKINDTIGLHMQKHMMHDEGSLMRNLTSSMDSNKQPHKTNFLFNKSFPNRKSDASCLPGKGTSSNWSHEILSLRYSLINKDGWYAVSHSHPQPLLLCSIEA